MNAFAAMSKKLNELHANFDGTSSAIRKKKDTEFTLEKDHALILAHWERLCGKENAVPQTVDEVLAATRRKDRVQYLKKKGAHPLPTARRCAQPSMRSDHRFRPQRSQCSDESSQTRCCR